MSVLPAMGPPAGVISLTVGGLAAGGRPPSGSSPQAARSNDNTRRRDLGQRDIGHHPLTPPAVNPPTRCFWRAKNKAMTGAETINAQAANLPHSTLYSPTYRWRATGRVKRVGSLINVAARTNSFHAVMKENSAVTASAGRASGNTTLMNTWKGEAPSITAASSSSRGSVSK